MLGSRRPRLARFLVALVFAALCAAPSMAQPREDGAMLSQLYDGSAQASLSGERPAVSLAFTLPRHVTVARARLILSARPAGETPGSALSVSLNAGGAIPLEPDPYPFTAQFDLAAAQLTGGENRLSIALSDCAAASGGAGWVIDLAQSRLDLVYLPAAPQDLDSFNAWFAADFPAPARIAIGADGVTPARIAELEALTAIALGRRTARPLSFVAMDEAHDLQIRFRLDERLAHARLLPSGHAPLRLDVLAPDAAAARNALRAFGEYSGRDSVRLADGGHGDLDYFGVRAGGARQGAVAMAFTTGENARPRLLANNEPAGRVGMRAGQTDRTIRLDDLQPGLNRITLGQASARCGDGPRIHSARFTPSGAPSEDLTRLAAGSLGRDGYSLVLPETPAPRRHALALLARLAWESRDYSAPGWVGFEALSAPADRDLAVLAPGGLLPRPLVDQSPRALAAAIRPQIPTERPPSLPVRVAGYAHAAGAPGHGVAARYPTPDAKGWTTIVTSPVTGDFGAALTPLIQARTLARLDGRVSRWGEGEVWIQDRGAWSPPGLAAMPPHSKELWFSLSCVFLVAALGVAHFGRDRSRRR